MKAVIGDAVAFDVGGDFFLVVGKIAQGIEDLGEREVGQVGGDVLRGDAEAQVSTTCARGCGSL